eukprot:gb/GECG01002162.1/.p1 GENE.gb/GECG01002162.1/~~gb/GECG01002162.1/.p1  ORF type:complete len:135 (+),score=21.47 gb/GECG01002162.1/:1-405(+)
MVEGTSVVPLLGFSRDILEELVYDKFVVVEPECNRGDVSDLLGEILGLDTEISVSVAVEAVDGNEAASLLGPARMVLEGWLCGREGVVSVASFTKGVPLGLDEEETVTGHEFDALRVGDDTSDETVEELVDVCA